MKKIKTAFFCQNCGHQSPKWLGKCPSCDEWNRFAEEEIRAIDPAGPAGIQFNEAPLPIDEIVADEKERMTTGISEMDRVLGGGIVNGSVTLVGGDPGIGKSTLLLQVVNNMAEKDLKILYISGEESAKQIKLRGKRIGASSKNLFVLVEIDLDSIVKHIKEISPRAVVIDSIQTMYSPVLTSAPGSVGQVRESSARLILLAKKTGIPIFLVGHVTKDGSIAGPKVLEHMVDTVLYFEGDSSHAYRIIRAIKNRFGPTNEIGVFEMNSSGLAEVKNPSEIFLSERPKDVSGSVVTSVLEGSRPLLVEIQSLVSKSSFGYARRRAQGFDYNRLALLVAVLEKRIGLSLEADDIFVNVAGGIKVEDPAADLAVAVAVSSAFREQLVMPETVVLGEVGLAGEIRSISQAVLRINEAEKLGFKHCIIPKNNYKNLKSNKGAIELIPVSFLKEALDVALSLPTGRQGGNK